MGGRDQRRDLADHQSWITEVSNERLERYSRMLDSGGKDKRVDGSVRVRDAQQNFRALIEKEQDYRKGRR